MEDAAAEVIADIERRIDGAERVMSRLLEGTYRDCEVCGEHIDEELLAERPVRTTCAAHPQLTD
jgi:RNA polymerase-binding transcription factor DksA